MSERFEILNDLISDWQKYLGTIDHWQKLVEDVEPISTGCGPVYELPNPINRPNESFAIADMTQLEIAEPHYHPTGVTEIYFVLQGTGKVVVAGKGSNEAQERNVSPGGIVILPENKAHFTIPQADLVVAVVNTPPFQNEHYIKIDPTVSHPELAFDTEQFSRLTNTVEKG